jgi:hypothetical protein
MSSLQTRVRNSILAAVTAIGMAAATSAVHAASVPVTVNLVAGANSTYTGYFGRSGIAAGSFEDMYLFNTPAGFASGQVGTTAVALESTTDVDFTSAIFTTSLSTSGTPLSILNSSDGLSEFRIINTVQVAAGLHSLVVQGRSRGNGAYSGVFTMEATPGGPGGTPVPGPVAGAGIPALIAIAGLAWARRRRASTAA